MMLVKRAAQVATGAAVLALMAQVAGAQAASGQKVAYIRSQAILQEAPGYLAAQAGFQQKMDSAGVLEKEWNDSLQAMFVAYGKEEASLSSTAKETRMKTIRDRQAELRGRDSSLRVQMGQLQNQVLGPFMEQINDVIENIRAQDGYAMIFDAQASGAGIVAVDKNLDLTDRVIARLKVLGPPSNTAPATNASTTPPAKKNGPVQTPSGMSRKNNN